ncbi:MAG TPA: radical SAM protein [Acidobacteriaceae bacterium]|nr:radical SAM protein [Acidobacteriaceae bacterium]
MRVHLINPSDKSFGIGVITPRWLYVLAAATPEKFGDPIIADETLAPFRPETVQSGDVVGIGIHTSNALRGMHLGKMARERGAHVVFGGVHASLYPEEALRLGGAHAVVKGDGDRIWGKVIEDLLAGAAREVYEGGRLPGDQFLPARWDLAPRDKYMWASVQTVRGCPKHCSFCSVWRTDGQKPRPRSCETVVREIVDLRRRGFRFVLLADDNFYPVSLRDLHLAEKQGNTGRVQELQSIRAERFELMSELAQLPKDMVFFTQITMEAGEDIEYLDAMKKAHISGALVGVESATPEGLKAIFKDFNLVGDSLAKRLQTFKQHGIYILGSFIFGLSTDREDTFAATAELARRAGLSFAQFVLLTPLPGTIDFDRWEKSMGTDVPKVHGIPITRYWLIPAEVRPNVFTPHATMSPEEIRRRTQGVWDEFYSMSAIWERSRCTPNLRARLAFVFISKLYRQMYAKTGIATDSARRQKASRMAHWLAIPCRKLFEAKPMPELKLPPAQPASSTLLSAL